MSNAKAKPVIIVPEPFRFQLTWRDAAYHVSKPNVDSMEVVSASDYDALKLRFDELQKQLAITS